jgi:hypothetical protein
MGGLRRLSAPKFQPSFSTLAPFHGAPGYDALVLVLATHTVNPAESRVAVVIGTRCGRGVYWTLMESL